MSERVLLALGVDHSAMDAFKAGGSDFRVSQATQFTAICHVPMLHKSSITSFERRQVNAVEFATKVCFSLFHGSEIGTKGKLVTCLAYIR